MNLGPVFFYLALLAQDQASVGVGAGIVRHEGGSSFSALTLSPAAQRLSSTVYLGASGALSALDEGAFAAQGRAEVWVTLPYALRDNVRVAVNAALAASTRSDGIGAGSGTAIVEMVWSTPRGGAAAGLGTAAGVIEQSSGVASVRLRARSWWQPSGPVPQLSFTIETTRFLGAWYTDFVGGATLENPRVVASLWLFGRASGTYGSTAAASASLQYFLKPWFAIEASGGSYLRDPFQGLPRAGFGGAGIRLFRSARSAPPRAPPRAPELRPLIAQRRGDTVVVRFRMEGATAVAIAGSWNNWTPELLRDLGADIWEAALQLAPGTYHFNLVVDGGEWVVPGGTATVSDGMGGLLAVLTVPPPPSSPP